MTDHFEGFMDLVDDVRASVNIQEIMGQTVRFNYPSFAEPVEGSVFFSGNDDDGNGPYINIQGVKKDSTHIKFYTNLIPHVQVV